MIIVFSFGFGGYEKIALFSISKERAIKQVIAAYEYDE